MGITNGTLVKRGNSWAWKYRADGQPRWESLKTASKHEAEIIRQQRIAEYHTDHAKFSRVEINPTIAGFEDRYFEWRVANRRPATIQTEKTYWKQLVAFTGAKRLGDIKQRNVEAFKAQLRICGVRGRPLKEGSVNDALRHLQAIFNHAVKLNLFTGANPVAKVERFRLTHKLPDFLETEEIAGLLKEAKAHSREIYWVCLLGIYAGLRKNEIVNVRWEWFDLRNSDEPTLRLQRHDGFELKDHEERALPLSSKILDAVRPHMKDSGFLFDAGDRNRGKWRYRYDPQRQFDTVKEKAKLPRLTFVLLRHTFASWHVMNGTEIALVSRWLGHSKIDITMTHYAGLRSYHKSIENF